MTRAQDQRCSAYAFEAKGIQGFILAGGRLRDAVGASILVDSLCLPADGATPPRPGLPAAGLLDDALAACGLQEGPGLRFTRRAAGAFTLVAVGAEVAPRLLRFRRLWTLTVAMAAPGLDFIDMLGTGETAPAALRAALAAGQGRRSRLATALPIAPPPARRAPRTGLAAVAVDRRGSDVPEPIDAATRRKRAHFEASGASESGARKWLGDQPPGTEWPANLETEFPFLGEDRTIGLLHADGNRMGQILMLLQRGLADAVTTAELPDDAFSAAEDRYLTGLLQFSLAVGQATEAAFRAALAEEILPRGMEMAEAGGRVMLPARPILMGGDDLTVLLRGDIALDFAATYLRHFEEEAAQALAPVLAGIGGAFPPLTACAGIAFVGDSFPFDRALRLAEDLCRHAKQHAKAAAARHDGLRVPSSLSFHRATVSLLDSYQEIEERDLVQRDGAGRALRVLSMQPYAVTALDAGLPQLGALAALRRMFGEGTLGRGPARELVELLQSAPEQVPRRYARWRQILGKGAGRPLAAFDAALRLLGLVDAPGHLDPAAEGAAPARTPLFDALTWHVVTRAAAAEATPEAVEA